MKEIRTEIVIQSNYKRVWETLTNFERQAEWNPFIVSLSGKRSVGAQWDVTVKPPNGSEMSFRPIVSAFDENKELRWKGKFLVKGIFDGEHYFVLSKESETQTRLIHGEKFSGLLVSLAGGMLRNTEKGFLAMNEALKEECERN